LIVARHFEKRTWKKRALERRNRFVRRRLAVQVMLVGVTGAYGRATSVHTKTRGFVD
jgi:hypothetical protein